jgi:virginiamycin B lyase
MKRMWRALSLLLLLAMSQAACASATSRTAAQISIYPVPSSASNPEGITAGPDGNLWIAESSANKVAKLTTSGTFTEYTISTPASRPAGIAASPGRITAGPDGNLWFIEAAAVARVTTSGVITEYPLPACQLCGGETNGLLSSITSGPDGNVWFTEYTRHMVAKVTTSGAITEYRVPSHLDSGASSPYGGSPSGITAGRDGNLWFVCACLGPTVDRVTTSGGFTEYPIPEDGIPLAYPLDITYGPDGNLWATMDTFGDFVARVTTGGAFKEYTFASFNTEILSSGIAAGPDGNLWMTDANDVSKIVPT